MRYEKNGAFRAYVAFHERFGDFDERDGAAAIIVSAISDRVGTRWMKLAKAVENRANLPDFSRQGWTRWAVGAEWADDRIERTE